MEMAEPDGLLRALPTSDFLLWILQNPEVNFFPPSFTQLNSVCTSGKPSLAWPGPLDWVGPLVPWPQGGTIQ
jgi:hypothetical protein